MLEFAMRAQIVAARIGGPAQWTLKAAGKMDVIVIAYVGDDFAAQFTTV